MLIGAESVSYQIFFFFLLLLPVWGFAVGFIWSRQRNFDLVADVLWSTVGVCGRDSAR